MIKLSNYEFKKIAKKIINECYDEQQNIHYTVEQINYKVGEIMRLNDFHYKYSKSLTDEEMELIREINEQYVMVFESDTASEISSALRTLIETISIYINYFSSQIAINALSEQLERLKNLQNSKIIDDDNLHNEYKKDLFLLFK